MENKRYKLKKLTNLLLLYVFDSDVFSFLPINFASSTFEYFGTLKTTRIFTFHRININIDKVQKDNSLERIVLVQLYLHVVSFSQNRI